MDNALAEKINGLYKTVLVHRQGLWHSVQALEMATPGLGSIGSIVTAFSGPSIAEKGNILPSEAAES